MSLLWIAPTKERGSDAAEVRWTQHKYGKNAKDGCNDPSLQPDLGVKGFPPSTVRCSFPKEHQQTGVGGAVTSEFNPSSARLPAAIPTDRAYTFKCCSLAPKREKKIYLKKKKSVRSYITCNS